MMPSMNSLSNNVIISYFKYINYQISRMQFNRINESNNLFKLMIQTKISQKNNSSFNKSEERRKIKRKHNHGQ